MEKLTRFLKVSSLTVLCALAVSCGAGVDYNHETATLTFIPGKIAFNDLKPDIVANQLAIEANKYEAAGKGDRAFKKYKSIADQYPLTTQAPNARYRMAQYYEHRDKRTKAFDNYQTLITNYMGTPLYRSALDRQIAMAHEAASGSYKKNMLFFKSKVPSTEVDRMLKQIIENAPHAPSASKSQYLRAALWEKEKRDVRAMVEYREVTRTYPDSGYSGEALFRIASILYAQSQKGNTNLDNSKRAIETFDELTTLYPKHPRSAEAKQVRAKIEGYDIRRSLEIAKFYEEKDEHVSAIFYYRDIMSRTSSKSEVHQQAKTRLNAITKESAR